MNALPRDPAHKTQNAVLRTTTWGMLLAVGLILTIWGISASAPGDRNRSQGPGSASLTSSARASADKGTTLAYEKRGLSSDLRHLVSQLSPFSASGPTTNPAPGAARTYPEQYTPTQNELKGEGRAPDGQLGEGAALPPTEAAAAAAAAKISPDLKNIDPEKPIDVIVQFKNGTGTDLTAAGATFKSDLPVIHAQLVSAKGGLLTSLASDATVAYITPDRKVRGATVNSEVTAVNADVAYNDGWNGAGIGVAVLDSGVSTVTDLNSDGNNNPSRVVYSQSFVPGYSNASDDFGHGTHVSGIIASNGYDSAFLQSYQQVYRGIAPEANIINLRVLDPNGAGTDSSVISAIQQAISLQSTYNIRVMNLSLARGVYESYTLDPLCQAVESAWQSGSSV